MNQPMPSGEIWPALGLEAVEGHCRNAAYVYADCREEQGRADSDSKPLVECAVVFRCSSDQMERIDLRARAVAAFFGKYPSTLAKLGVTADIDPMPVELKEPVRFDKDTAHAIQADAYFHECISAGFWPGNGGYGRTAEPAQTILGFLDSTYSAAADLAKWTA